MFRVVDAPVRLHGHQGPSHDAPFGAVARPATWDSARPPPLHPRAVIAQGGKPRERIVPAPRAGWNSNAAIMSPIALKVLRQLDLNDDRRAGWRRHEARKVERESPDLSVIPEPCHARLEHPALAHPVKATGRHKRLLTVIAVKGPRSSIGPIVVVQVVPTDIRTNITRNTSTNINASIIVHHYVAWLRRPRKVLLHWRLLPCHDVAVIRQRLDLLNGERVIKALRPPAAECGHTWARVAGLANTNDGEE